MSRPSPLDDRPFFRPEAEAHRLHRHLGEVRLARPVSVRLVYLIPLVATALLSVAASLVTFRPRVELTHVPVELGNGDVGLVLPAPRAAVFPVGRAVELLGGDDRPLATAEVIAAGAVPCVAAPASAMPPDGCTQLRVRPAVATTDGRHGAVASVRGAPRHYFSLFDRDPPAGEK
ncbi:MULTISPECIES: hypothetical protein [unclassified Stenotrophomonas]|uniref:hypothetical protein n=1 Tax=unclassified Stenotrophomonas TaxID=196198 RepID=UPI003BF8FD42